MVAVSDCVSALPDQLARFLEAPMVSLGPDGYGLSDTQEALRAYFGTAAAGITTTAARMAGDKQSLDGMLTAIPEQHVHRGQHLVA